MMLKTILSAVKIALLVFVSLTIILGASSYQIYSRTRAEMDAETVSASRQIALTIGQVNDAVTEMDKMTQQTAANAEELNVQAEQMKGYDDKDVT